MVVPSASSHHRAANAVSQARRASVDEELGADGDGDGAAAVLGVLEATDSGEDAVAELRKLVAARGVADAPSEVIDFDEEDEEDDDESDDAADEAADGAVRKTPAPPASDGAGGRSPASKRHTPADASS
jgi:hypothetical protein